MGWVRDAGRFHVEQQERHAHLRPLEVPGTHETEHPVRVVRVCGPDLRAVDDVVVAVGDGGGLQAGEIGTRLRFGITLTPEVVAAQHARQIVVALFLRAAAEQGRAEHREAHRRHRRRVRARAFAIEDVALRHRPDRCRRIRPASSARASPSSSRMRCHFMPVS